MSLDNVNGDKPTWTGNTCIDADELAAAAAGLIPLSRAEVVFEHVSECPQCEEILVEQEKRPQYSRSVAGAVETSSHQSGPTTKPQQINDYLLEKQLGEGGLGVVYLARHQLLSNCCVIKVIQNRHALRHEVRQRFFREMKVLSGLKHENIVQVLNAGWWNDQPYMVMEYLEGDDLEHYVSRHGPLPLTSACEVIADAATALQHAHNKGVTHRDIKPSNVFATEDGTTKVIDFGLARVLSDTDQDAPDLLTGEGVIPGTPQYMSPEQFRSSRVDSSSDIYSLGGTFVFLLTGSPPVKGDAMDLLRHHSEPEVVDPAPELNRFPPTIGSLVRRMLARDPAQRPATMNEIAVTLRTFFGQTQTDPTSAPTAVTPAAGPNRWRILMFSSLAVITPLILVMAFSWPIQLVSGDRRPGTDVTDEVVEHPTVTTAIRAVAKFELTDELHEAVTSSIRRRNDATELVDDAAGFLYSLRVVSLPGGANGKRLWPAVLSREQTKATARLLKVESIRQRARSAGLTDTSGLDEAIDIAAADPRFVGTVQRLSSHQLIIDDSAVALVCAPQQQIDATLQSEPALGRLREAYRDALHRQSRRLMERGSWSESLELWRHLHQLELTSPELYVDTARCFLALQQTEDAIGLLKQTLGTHAETQDWLFFQEVGDLLITIETPEAQEAAIEAFELAATKYTIHKQ